MTTNSFSTKAVGDINHCMSNSYYNDADVTVLQWADGCINAFFSHDTIAINVFIAEKKRAARDSNLTYTTKNITKSEYDRTMGFTSNI